MFKKKYFHIISFGIFVILLLPFIYIFLSKKIFSNIIPFYHYLSAGSYGTDLFTSFGYTLFYMFTTVFGQLLLGIYAAYLTFFSSKPKLYIFIFFIPYILPLFLSTLAIRLGFEPDGYVSNFLINGTQKYSPLRNDYFHLFIIILLSIWQYFPFVFIFSYTMMKRINNVFILSSITDGASNITIFKKVLLPNIKKIIFPLIMLRLLFMFNKYEMVSLFSKSNEPTQKTISLLPIYLRTFFNSTNETRNSYGYLIVFITMLVFFVIWYILNKVFSRITEKV